MRDHGGNIDEAIAEFGGAPECWIDLSTGINRAPFPVPAVPPSAWQDLPVGSAFDRVRRAAVLAYGVAAEAEILPVAGAQAAIQMVPRLAEFRLGKLGEARVLSPTYNEHAAVLRAAGWEVREVARLGDLAGADLGVVVNPNNPDGRQFSPTDLLALARGLPTLIVDESFMDATPSRSLAPHAGQPGLVILRSLGKFYGLAGVRLGFVIGHGDDLARLQAMAGPWAVSGVALAVGEAALADRDWQAATRMRLQSDVCRLDRLATASGWTLVGGTALYRTYETPSALAARDGLARQRIWSRVFPYSQTWLRLGLPGSETEWQRVGAALSAD